MSADDRMIPRLLAGRDQLSRPEQDAIFERVAAPAPTARKWWWLAAPVLVAGIVLVAVAPWRAASTDDFAARGGSRPIAALHVTCSAGAGAAPGACAAGAKLLFDVHGTSAYRYFAAFAKRGDGTVLWYFPTADDATGVELATAPNGVLDRGIVLGAEHAAGTYRVYGVFSTAPLTRAQIRNAFDAEHLTAGAGTNVVTTDVEVR